MNEIYATIGDYEEEDPYTSPYGLVLQIPFNAGSFNKIIIMKDECDVFYSFLYSIALKTLFRLSPNVICSLIMANVLLKDWIQFYLQSKACMTSKYSSIHPVLLGSEVLREVMLVFLTPYHTMSIFQSSEDCILILSTIEWRSR